MTLIFVETFKLEYLKLDPLLCGFQFKDTSKGNLAGPLSGTWSTTLSFAVKCLSCYCIVPRQGVRAT